MRHFTLIRELLTILNIFLDFSFLCRHLGARYTVSAFPHVLTVGGGTAFPRVPLHYTTATNHTSPVTEWMVLYGLSHYRPSAVLSSTSSLVRRPPVSSTARFIPFGLLAASVTWWSSQWAGERAVRRSTTVVPKDGTGHTRRQCVDPKSWPQRRPHVAGRRRA